MTSRLIALNDGDSRVETGVTQIGVDDWPGVFIRGDNAGYYALCLEDVLAGRSNPIYKEVVNGLLELLKSSNVRNI